METNSKYPRISLAVYFILAISFSILAGLTARHIQIHPARLGGVSISYGGSALFWIFLVLTILCTLPLVVDIIQRLSKKETAGGAHEGNLKTSLLNFMRGSELSYYVALCLFAGIGILLVNEVLRRSRVIPIDTINGRVYDYLQSIKGDIRGSRPFTQTLRLQYLTPSNDPKQQMKECSTIVQDVWAAGAKAVVLYVPVMHEHEKMAEFFNAVDSTGKTIFATTAPQHLTLSMRVMRHGMPYTCYGVSQNCWLSFRMGSVDVRDFVMQVLKSVDENLLYHYPKFQDETITLGNIIIPTSQYTLLVKDDYGSIHDAEIIAHATKIAGTSSFYNSFLKDGKMEIQRLDIFRSSQNEESAALSYSKYYLNEQTDQLREIDKKSFTQEVNGKVVFIGGNLGRSIGHFMIDRAYVIAVENILSGNYTTKWHTGYIWITLFGLLLAGIVAYRFSPIQSALIIFLITILSIALCSYLFEQYDMVVDVLYPSLSLGIALFLFPLLLLAIRYRLNRTHAF